MLLALPGVKGQHFIDHIQRVYTIAGPIATKSVSGSWANIYFITEYLESLSGHRLVLFLLIIFFIFDIAVDTERSLTVAAVSEPHHSSSGSHLETGAAASALDTVIEHKGATNSSPVTSRAPTLTVDNTQDVFEMMYDAREKWRNIGGFFRLSESTLNNIDAELRKNDDKLRSVISEWLKKFGGMGICTWTQVAMALRNKTVGHEDLAQEVFEKYPRTKDITSISVGPEDHTGSQDGTAAHKAELDTENIAVMKQRHKAMPLKDREQLDRMNRKASEELSEEFAALHVQTQIYLRETNCDVSSLLACVMDVRVVKQAAKVMSMWKLENATAVGGVFVALIKMNLISYLQFSIVERIVKVLCTGSPDLQEKLQKYKDNFQKYILRRVCDSTVYQEGKFESLTSSDSKEVVELILITDDKWNEFTPFLEVLELKDIVAQYLNINDFNMELVNISPHCLKLHLAISIAIALSIFPLTQEEWNKLTSLGIVELKCLDLIYKKGMQYGRILESHMSLFCVSFVGTNMIMADSKCSMKGKCMALISLSK